MDSKTTLNPTAHNAWLRMQETLEQAKEASRTNTLNEYMQSKIAESMEKAAIALIDAVFEDDRYAIAHRIILAGTTLAVRTVMELSGADFQTAYNLATTIDEYEAEAYRKLVQEKLEVSEEDLDMFAIVKEYLDGVYTLVKESPGDEEVARREWDRRVHVGEDTSDIEKVWGDPSLPGHPWNLRSSYDV